MWQDLRHAARLLGKHPSFVCLSALLLGLGIGLNTALFSIVYAILFKPLPVESPHDLVSIYQVLARQPDRPTVLNSLQYEHLKRHNEAFTDITAHVGITYTLRANDETDAITAEWVMSNYFDVLGVRPLLGRTLVPSEDDVANPERAVVISHTLWTRRFQRDPQILGKQIHVALGNQPGIGCTIVGVTGPDFKGVSAPWKPTHLWITFAQGRDFPERGFAGAAIARLKPGVNVEQAQAIVAAQARQFYDSRPAARAEFEPPRLIAYRTNDIRVPFDPSAAVIPTRLAAALTIVVAMVLLVAAANIAGVLLARGVGRSGEIAVQRVLGAAPLRIVRQLLAESLMLSLAGGIVGIVLAQWLVSLFRTLAPIQFAVDVALEGRVFLFTAAICLAAGVVVAVVPAKQATSIDIVPWLAGTGAMQTKPVGRRLRHAVTLPQVALCLVLLLVAVVYVRELVRVELADAGYQPRNLLVATPVLQLLPGEQAPRGKRDAQREERFAERARRFYQQLLVQLRDIPGVRDAALADGLPLREPAERPNWSVVTQESVSVGRSRGVGSERASVSPGYFRVMDMTLLAGRDFDERDTPQSSKVAVISAALAQRLWPGRDAVGRTVGVVNEWAPTDGIEWYEVIGVVTDVNSILHERAVRPLVYLPLGQQWRPWISYVLVRGSGDSRALIPVVKDAVARADGRADVSRMQTMSQMIAEILYLRRIAAAVLGISAIVAILLAALGVYGVVSYSIAQRIGEIGVRIALGAERSQIVRLLLREGAAVAALGSGAGLVLGYTAIKVTSSRYLALPAVDIITLTLTPALLSTVVLLACYIPAIRAARLDPIEVLRRS